LSQNKGDSSYFLAESKTQKVSAEICFELATIFFYTPFYKKWKMAAGQTMVVEMGLVRLLN
jgi:hypothetical protein